MTSSNCRSLVLLLLFLVFSPSAIAQSRPVPTDAADRPVRDASGHEVEYTNLPVGDPVAARPATPSLVAPAAAWKSGASQASLGLAGETPVYAEVWRTASFGQGIGETGIWPSDVDNDGDNDLVVSGNSRFWSIVSYDDASGTYGITWQSEPYMSEWITALRVVEDQSTRRIWVGLDNGVIDVFDSSTRELVATLTVGSSIEDFATGDADNDGTSDVLVLTNGEIRLYDPLTLALVRSYPHGGGAVALGNIDADDRTEVVVNTGLVLELNGPDVAFEWVTDEFGAQIELGDIDADGMDELVGAASWYTMHAWDLDAKSIKWSLTADLDIAAMRLFDVTDDGIPELVYGDGQWGAIYAIDAATQTELWNVPNPEHGVTDIAVVDSDGDGDLELLWGAGHTSSGPDYLYVHDLATGSLEWQSEHVSGPYEATALGDVDADGALEFVVASYDSESGYADGVVMVVDAATHVLEWQSGTNTFGGSAWTGVHDLVLANVDADVQLEIIVGTDRLYDGALYVIDGQTHELQHEAFYDDGSPFLVLDTADLTGDGRPEVIAGNTVAHTGSPGVYVYVLDPLADAVIWKSAAVASGFSAITDVRAADVGAPGIDLLAASGKLNVIRWSDKRHLTTTDRGYRSVAASDIDGSQELEILGGRNNGAIDVLDGETLAVNGTYTVCTSPVLAIEPMPSRRVLVACGDKLVVYDLASGAAVSTTDSTVAHLGLNGSLDTGVINGRAIVLAGGQEAVAFADVSDNHAPVLSPLNTSVHWRDEVDVQLAATDEDGDAMVFELTSLPSLGTATWQDPTAGELHYAANGLGTGVDSMAVRVSDGYQYSAPEMVEITLTNTPPSVDTPPIELHWRGEQSVGVTASDPDGDPLSYSLSTAPSHGTASMDAATGVLGYAPTGAYVGDDMFAYAVTDGADTSEETVSILLTNTTPTASAQDYNISPGNTIASRFPAEDPDEDPLNYSIVSEPTQGQLTFEAETGLFEYVPATGGTGTDTATFEVSDGIAQAQGTVRFRYPSPSTASDSGGGGSAGWLLPLLLAAGCARRWRDRRLRAWSS